MVRSHTLALLLVVLAQSTSESLAEPSQRTVWTTSRFIGSPDPPKPFTVELAFPHFELPNLVYLEREPAADTFLLVQHIVNWNGPTRILRVRPAGSADDAERLLELRHLVYSLAFHPDFENNGFIYFFGNGRDASGARTNEILRYTMDRNSGDIAEDSAKLIIAWPSAGHDGGGIAFDKSGLMYLSAGDGSSTSDEHDTGQRLDDLPGSILRIDVDHVQANQTYSIPADNPFVGQENVRPEIYAYGLRNPWRLTYDTISDQLWTGINGQDLWESAQLVRKGENYGWPIMEANHPFQLERQIGPSPIVRNTVEHPHSEARSLTGGFVYRGDVWPELQGAYLYG
ncbi:MAG: PQQ-dependent sugar dehydrogenase, partial [Planctomycetales bacterium]|nr:PQQ-dependent sugar dehydrogenase [Planctomycetales bacterium]